MVVAAAFFVSYTASDRPWAEWIAWQLEAAGNATVLQAWDFQVGSDFVHQMQQAVQRADRTVAVLSPAYFGSAFGEAEWRAAFAKDPTGERGLLVPVRVRPCNPPGLLSTRVYVDLVDLDEPAARARLLAAVQQRQRPGRPQTAPGFPGLTAAPESLRPVPRFPGPGPAVSNLAPRNPNFTGRADLLETLARQLAVGARTTAVVAAYGLGGVGKSQLALEYAYRHAADYDLVWWVAAETPLVAAAGLAALALRLGLDPQPEQAEQVAAVLAELAALDRWLLVFDNAEQPQDLQGLLPHPGAGQVLVTSRNPAWGRVAARLRVEVLDPLEAMALLVRRSGDTDRAAAAALAGELGELPLALEQAAAYCEQTSLPLAGYLARYRHDHARLLTAGAPVDYPATVVTTWRLNVEQAAQAFPAALPLLRLAAFLAPEAIPPDLLAADPEVLPTELAAAAADDLVLDEAVGALYRYSLLARDQDGLRLHRLVQAIVRDDLADQQPAWTEIALRLVTVGFPPNATDVATWPACQRLLAHALAVADHAERLMVDPDQTSVLLNHVGSYLRGRAQFHDARVSFERALALAEGTYGPDRPEVATIVNNLGGALRQLGDLPGAKASFQRALRIDQAAYGPHHPEVATDIHNLSNVLQDLGDYAGARAGFEQALAIDEAALGPDHTSVARDRNCLGLVLLDLGDPAGAKASFQRAVAIDEAAHAGRPALARSLNNLARALHQLGDLHAAKAHLERALSINEAAYGPDHPAVANIVNNLGDVLQDLGDLPGAKANYQRALGITEAIFGADHPAVSPIISNLGDVLQDLGDLTGAHANYQRALAIDETALGPDHPDVAIDLNNLGMVLYDLGDLDGAREALQRAVAISTVVYGADHPNTQHMVEKLDAV